MDAGKPARIVRASWEIRPRAGGPPIRGDLRAPEGRPPETAVVLCHGFKGFRRWGFFPELARALARQGHAAISFDFSRNGVGEDGVDFSALELFREATHTRNLEEIRMVLDALTRGPIFPRPPRAIGLFGHSRGGGEAILAANEDSRVQALVTWSAISRVRRWSPEQIATWEAGGTVMIRNARTGQEMPVGAGYWEDLVRNERRLDILTAAAAIAVPWLIVHGEADETVPVEEARRLYEASGSGTEMLLVEGAGHTFGATHPPGGTPPDLATVMDATMQWFGRHLGLEAPL